MHCTNNSGPKRFEFTDAGVWACTRDDTELLLDLLHSEVQHVITGTAITYDDCEWRDSVLLTCQLRWVAVKAKTQRVAG